MQFFSKLSGEKIRFLILPLLFAIALWGAFHTGGDLLIWNRSDSYTVCLDAGHGGSSLRITDKPPGIN